MKEWKSARVGKTLVVTIAIKSAFPFRIAKELCEYRSANACTNVDVIFNANPFRGLPVLSVRFEKPSKRVNKMRVSASRFFLT